MIRTAKHCGFRCLVKIGRRNLCEVAEAGSGRADGENSLSLEKTTGCQTSRSQRLTSDCSQSSNLEFRPDLRLCDFRQEWRGVAWSGDVRSGRCKRDGDRRICCAPVPVGICGSVFKAELRKERGGRRTRVLRCDVMGRDGQSGCEGKFWLCRTEDG